MQCGLPGLGIVPSCRRNPSRSPGESRGPAAWPLARVGGDGLMDPGFRKGGDWGGATRRPYRRMVAGAARRARQGVPIVAVCTGGPTHVRDAAWTWPTGSRRTRWGEQAWMAERAHGEGAPTAGGIRCRLPGANRGPAARTFAPVGSQGRWTPAFAGAAIGGLAQRGGPIGAWSPVRRGVRCGVSIPTAGGGDDGDFVRCGVSGSPAAGVKIGCLALLAGRPKGRGHAQRWPERNTPAWTRPHGVAPLRRWLQN